MYFTCVCGIRAWNDFHLYINILILILRTVLSIMYVSIMYVLSISCASIRTHIPLFFIFFYYTIILKPFYLFSYTSFSFLISSVYYMFFFFLKFVFVFYYKDRFFIYLYIYLFYFIFIYFFPSSELRDEYRRSI